MNTFKCKSCGGETEKKGNVYICVYCQSRWEQDLENDINAVDRAGAWKSLREGDFEKAQVEFENIIGKEKTNYEAWWGKALADNHITYVNDLNENKKVPTCNNITNDVFADSTAVKNAIANAPMDIAEGYKKMAEQIDKIRVEWINLASKEPPYDVFISYKDSDKERGLTRTQDSIDAQDLYNALVAEGYKVFFSRISLRDKISEQYEPYIYNAIRTAKVMIVFGEKTEYFSSTWIKNEWSRFRTRIEKKEKHKNSLVVVYKDMDPNALPVSLRSRQCMNMSDMTFLSDLNRHIARIIESEKAKAGLERISIESGVIGKKATRLEVNEVKTKELNTGETETDITALQTLKLVDSYLAAKSWDSASRFIDQVLFDEPGSPEATWRLLLLEMQAENDEELIKKINYFKNEQYERLIKILDNAPAAFASEKLKLMFKALEYASDEMGEYLLDRIMVYSFTGRSQSIKSAFSLAIKNRMYKTFCKLLSLLDSSKVDEYIDYNMKYAKTWNTEACIDRVLAVDEGNGEALWFKFYAQKNKDGIIKAFEDILKFSAEPDKEVIRYLNEANGRATLSAVTRVIRYFKGDIKDIVDQIKICADKLLTLGLFADAEECYRLALSVEKNYAEGYWGICLSVFNAKDESGVISGDRQLSDIPEYSKYLTLVTEDRRQECIALEARQKERFTTIEEASKVIHAIDAQDLPTLKMSKVKYESNICAGEREVTKFDNILRKYNSGVENDYKSLKNDLSQKKREVEKLTAEYNSLGLFSGTRKREIESEKNALNNHIAEIDKKIKAYEKEFPGMDRGDLISKKEKAQKLIEKDRQELKVIEEKIREAESIVKILSVAEINEYYKKIKYQEGLNKIYGIGRIIDSSNRVNTGRSFDGNNEIKVNESLTVSRPLMVSGYIPGSTISFGKYRYIILERQGDRALLLSISCTEKCAYNEKSVPVTWEKSTIRSYLNYYFYQNAFDEMQKRRILTSSVINKDNSKYGTKGGNNTQDKVFLLSLDEVKKYFPSDEKRIAKLKGDAVWWWLRSPGNNTYNAANVGNNGVISEYGNYVQNVYGAVRPALWVDISNI